MTNVIDFQVERAVRKSGIKDKALLKDIISEGYDPCDPIEVSNYYSWKQFEGGISTELEHNWSDEAIRNLLTDIKMFDPDQPYTVTTSDDLDILYDGDYEIIIDDTKSSSDS